MYSNQLSDTCIAPMGVTADLIFDLVGRLMQLLRAPQFWANIDQWMGMLCFSKGQYLMVATIGRSYRSPDDEVL